MYLALARGVSPCAAGKLHVKPRRGDAVLFWSTHMSGHEAGLGYSFPDGFIVVYRCTHTNSSHHMSGHKAQPTVVPRVIDRSMLLHPYKLAAQAEKGTSWRPLSEDPASLHGGCPVVAGHKWTATKWLRVGPYGSPRQGLHSSTSHLNLRRSCHSNSEHTQRTPHKVLNFSFKVD